MSDTPEEFDTSAWEESSVYSECPHCHHAECWGDLILDGGVVETVQCSKCTKEFRLKW